MVSMKITLLLEIRLLRDVLIYHQIYRIHRLILIKGVVTHEKRKKGYPK